LALMALTLDTAPPPTQTAPNSSLPVLDFANAVNASNPASSPLVSLAALVASNASDIASGRINLDALIGAHSIWRLLHESKVSGAAPPSFVCLPIQQASALGFQLDATPAAANATVVAAQSDAPVPSPLVSEQKKVVEHASPGHKQPLKVGTVYRGFCIC
jgi:hypothetical protein